MSSGDPSDDWPASWTLSAFSQQLRDGSESEFTELHQVPSDKPVVFREAWESKLFLIPRGAVMVRRIRLEFTGNGGGSHLSVGKILFYA